MRSSVITTVSSRALLESCQRLGLDVEAMLACAGLTRAQVWDPDGHLPGSAVAQLWREGLARSGNPDLALHSAEQLPFGAYKVIDFLVAASPTVGEGLEAIGRYFPLINNTIQLRVGRDRSRVWLAYSAAHPERVHLEQVEHSFAAILLRSRHGTGLNYPLERVDFRQAPRDSTSEAERIFGCPVHYRQTESRLVMSQNVWTLATTQGNEGLASVLREHAQLLLDQRVEDSDLIARLRTALSRELVGGTPTLGRVSEALSVSVRTLQRRLSERGLSFKQVLDEQRARAAEDYLAQRDFSIQEVAFLLGFSAQSSFSRSFKRWTGQSPREWRKAAWTAPPGRPASSSVGHACSSAARHSRFSP